MHYRRKTILIRVNIITHAIHDVVAELLLKCLGSRANRCPTLRYRAVTRAGPRGEHRETVNYRDTN